MKIDWRLGVIDGADKLLMDHRNRQLNEAAKRIVALEAEVSRLSKAPCNSGENVPFQWKRPLNVDVICKLRVMGWARSSFTFESDEGDGYDIIENYEDGEGPTLKQHHYEEWAEQLSYAAEWCREQAQLKTAESQTTNAEQAKIDIRNDQLYAG